MKEKHYKHPKAETSVELEPNFRLDIPDDIAPRSSADAFVERVYEGEQTVASFALENTAEVSNWFNQEPADAQDLAV